MLKFDVEISDLGLGLDIGLKWIKVLTLSL